MTQALVILLALQIKHLCADYLFQTDYMVAHKGTYRHPGGLLHAGLHAILTAIILGVAGVPMALVAGLSAAEFIAHYHIDWGKEQVSRRAALTPDKVNFWRAHGIDQMLHQVTYLALVWWIYG
ncbi:MAG: DUF3307 domain-containing protein [Pseudomonadota bacterium]